MARVAAKFTKADLERALRATKDAGIDISLITIRNDGTIEISTGKPQEPAGANDLDHELAEFEARHGED